MLREVDDFVEVVKTLMNIFYPFDNEVVVPTAFFAWNSVLNRQLLFYSLSGRFKKVAFLSNFNKIDTVVQLYINVDM